MSYLNVNKVRVVGHVIDDCSRCGDKLPLEKYDKQWLCSDCLKVYKRSLESVRYVKDNEKQKTRFHELVDNQ